MAYAAVVVYGVGHFLLDCRDAVEVFYVVYHVYDDGVFIAACGEGTAYLLFVDYWRYGGTQEDYSRYSVYVDSFVEHVYAEQQL